MKVAFAIDDTVQTIEAAPLDVVRLVASSQNIDDVDVEVLPEKTTITTSKFAVTGKTLTTACGAFFKRALA